MGTGTDKTMAYEAFTRAYLGAGGLGDPLFYLSHGRVPFPDLKAPSTINRGWITYRKVHQDEGRGAFEISGNVPQMRGGALRLPRSDLRLIAIAAASAARSERRRAAISAMTDEIDPLWSMTAHPVVAAAIALENLCLVPKRIGEGKPLVADEGAESDEFPTEYRNDGGVSHVLKFIAGHVWASFILDDTGLKIHQSRGRNTVRLEVAGRNIPDTAATALRGRPIAELLGHPVLDHLGHLPIHRIFNVTPDRKDKNGQYMNPRVCIDVVARPVPLAPAPAGADMSWTVLPSLHYADLD